jgi:hypothetical protein
LGPLPIGGVLALAILGAAALGNALGSPTDYARKSFEARLPFMFAGSTIWLYWLVAVHARGMQRDFDVLRPRLVAPSVELASVRARLVCIRPSLMWAATALAIVGSAIAQEFNTQRWTRFASGDWNAFDVTSAATATCFNLLVFQGYGLVISSSLALRRIGGELLDLQPFDTTAFEPFTRSGLRTVLLIVATPMVGFSVIQYLVGAPPETLISFFCWNLALAVLCVAIPTQAVVARVRQWRREELERVGRAIAGDGAALAESRFAHDLEVLDFTGLLAYRREVESARTNPLDWGSLTRFVLYVVLPPLSWVAAALVERVVDRALG